MKKVILLVVFLMLSFNTFSQGEKGNYNYRKFFTELRHYTNLPDGYGGFNIGYLRIAPMKLDGKMHSNIMHGLEFQFQGSLHEGGELLTVTPPDIMNMRLSYVAGYNHNLSKQLSLFGSIKPSLSWTGLFSEVDVPVSNTNLTTITEDKIDSNFDFVGLIGAEVRYFFSEEGKHGIAAEIFTSIEGGYGFTVGYTWRR